MKIRLKIDSGDVPDLAKSLMRMDGAKRGLSVAALYLKGQLQEYPVQPVGVSYVRTGNLKNRWTNKPSKSGFTQTIGNNALYADDVQGEQKGNPYFRRVWGSHSVRSVVGRERNRVVEIIQNEVNRSI